MYGETRAFVQHVIFDGDGALDTLLTSSETFVNGRLAEFYGIEGVTGDDFVRVDLPEDRALGILGHGSLTANSTDSTNCPSNWLPAKTCAAA
jgi:hypothetical protein